MPKKTTFWLTMMLSMLLSLLIACGPGPSTGTAPSSRTSATKLPPGENLYVLDGYTSAGTTSTAQQIIVFHPGSPSPNKLLTLPAGLTSMDHRSLYIAASQGGQTTISVINTQSGATIRSLVIPGNYSTAGQSFANAVLSFDGQWLALRELGQAGNVTTIALVDTQAGKLVKTIHLDGNFDLDAVNPDGAALYLLQRLNDGSGHYYVELYNVKENELYQNPIVDKTQLDETRMTGTALARQMASDGTMAYTLYIDTFNNKAFVHILPLDPGFPLARCVDLPVGKSADLLHYYTLTLSPDGSTLYAANGALGVASEINLQAGGTSNIYSDNLVATAHFNPGNASTTSGENMRMLYNGTALSPDQGTLYFVGMQGIWSVNTLDLHAKRNIFAHYLTQQTFTGIAMSADGRMLYAVDPKHGITVLDTRTGQAQGVIQGPAHSPWGIAWITD
jgi:DNA-binding beta-propeller fold protein YncE